MKKLFCFMVYQFMIWNIWFSSIAYTDNTVIWTEVTDGNLGYTVAINAIDNLSEILIKNPFLKSCGNWSVDKWETCDDGNTISWDWCSSSCQFEKACSDISLS